MSPTASAPQAPAFVIGAQKAGTSTVHEVLTNAGVRTARIKETHYFSDDERYARGIEWYDSQFNDPITASTTCAPRVEIDPAYLLSAAAPRRIRAQFGNHIRYVVVLRDPYERALSQYRMTVARGRESRPFLAAIEAEASRCEPFEYPESADVAYLGGSQYLRLLERWQTALPEAERLIIDFDALVKRNDPAIWSTLCDFLGVARIHLDELPKSNAAFAPKSRLLNRFLFDRSDYSGARRILHTVVPSERLRERAAEFLYARNRTAAPAATTTISAADNTAAKRIVRDHVGYDRADMTALLDDIDWPTLQPAGESTP